jgi:hypothetical protein
MRWILFSVVLNACVPTQPTPVVTTPEPRLDPTAAPDPSSDPWEEPVEEGVSTAAKRVCTRLRALKCDEGKATAEGASCERVLDNATREGIDLIGDVACVERATACDQARSCERQ